MMIGLFSEKMLMFMADFLANATFLPEKRIVRI